MREFVRTNFSLPLEHAFNERKDLVLIPNGEIGKGLAFAGKTPPDFRADSQVQRERPKTELPFAGFAALISE